MIDSTVPSRDVSGALYDSAYMRMKACRYGAVLYNTHDTYVGRSFDLYGEYGEDEMGLLANFVPEGGVVLDVGANIGAHTQFFAQRVGPAGLVAAFEPQRMVFQTLCANIALNAFPNVMTFHAGVGAAPGSIMVPRPDYAQDGNFGGVSLGGEEGEPVQVLPLDHVGVAKVDLVKIDVEGMEVDVLQGARGMIAHHRPVLYVENDRREKSPALLGLLFELGYRVYWHVSPLFNPNNFFANAENVFGSIASINALCLPRETAQNVQGLREVQDASEFPL